MSQGSSGAGDSGSRLEEILDALQEQLAEHPDLDRDSREALESAKADIQEALEQGPEYESGIQARLREAIERFEKEHPSLTQVVGRLADALADLGI